MRRRISGPKEKKGMSLVPTAVRVRVEHGVPGTLRKNILSLLVTALLGLFVLAVSLMESSYRAVWHDEIFTESIARLERVDDVWWALARGTDLNPPLYYLAVRCADNLLGKTPLALRLPSALGYLLLSVCLYRFVARWYPVPYAWLAMLLPLITQASWYSCEGRPYGLLLGFSALALICWQDATDGVRRSLALAGLMLSLAAAVSTHYYAVLIIVPLAAGEGVRTWTRKRVDIAIWAAFLLGLLPLLAYMPLMAEGRIYAPTFWSKPSWREALRSYSTLFPESAPILMALLFLTVVANPIWWPAFAEESPAGNRAVFPLHDLAAAVAFAAMPVFAVALAIIGKLGYAPRYAITTVIGVSLLVAVTAHRLARGRTAPAIVLAIALIVWYTHEHYDVIEIALARASLPSASARQYPRIFDRVGDADLPVAVASARLYLESINGLPAKSDPRLVFVSGEANTATRSLRALSRLRPLNVVTYASFLAAHRRFLLYTIDASREDIWLTIRLLVDGAKVTIKAQNESFRLYEVETRGR